MPPFKASKSRVGLESKITNKTKFKKYFLTRTLLKNASYPLLSPFNKLRTMNTFFSVNKCRKNQFPKMKSSVNSFSLRKYKMI